MQTVSTTRLSAFIAIGVVLACVPLLVVLSRSPGPAPIEPAAAPAAAPKVARAASHSVGSISSQFIDNSRGLVESAAAPTDDTIPTRAPTTQRTIRRFGESGSDGGVVFTVERPTTATAISFESRYGDTPPPTVHGHYVLASATFENRSARTLKPLSGDGARLIDTDGHAYPLMTLAYQIHGNRRMGDRIEHGKRGRRTLAFEVRPGARLKAIEVYEEEYGQYDGAASVVRFVP